MDELTYNLLIEESQLIKKFITDDRIGLFGGVFFRGHANGKITTDWTTGCMLYQTHISYYHHTHHELPMTIQNNDVYYRIYADRYFACNDYKFQIDSMFSTSEQIDNIKRMLYIPILDDFSLTAITLYESPHDGDETSLQWRHRLLSESL